MNAELASAFVLLFLVLDPLGNLPVVSPMLKGIPSPRRAKVVVRECFLAYLILIAFMFFGRQFLDVMHLSEISLSIAGGVILFMISPFAWSFLRPGTRRAMPWFGSHCWCRWPFR